MGKHQKPVCILTNTCIVQGFLGFAPETAPFSKECSLSRTGGQQFRSRQLASWSIVSTRVTHTKVCFQHALVRLDVIGTNDLIRMVLDDWMSSDVCFCGKFFRKKKADVHPRHGVQHQTNFRQNSQKGVYTWTARSHKKYRVGIILLEVLKSSIYINIYIYIINIYIYILDSILSILLYILST